MKKIDYINTFDHADSKYPFQVFVGGRGTGKTYSTIKHFIDPKNPTDDKMLLMRRTGKELKTLVDRDGNEIGNPFKTLNEDLGVNIGIKQVVEDLCGIYHREENPETGKLVHFGKPIGMACALTTIANVRGMDYSDITDIVWDEFIPEKHVKRMRGESDAFLNAYETINRNREFIGKPAVRAWLLANSNDIHNPMFQGLGLVAEAEKLVRSGKQHKYFKDRGLALHILDSPESFVEQKRQTALYKLTAGTQFSEMALDNSFAYNDFSLVGYKNIVGYIPVCSIGPAYLYKKKGDSEYYVSYASARCTHFNEKETQDCIRFKQQFGCALVPYFIEGRIFFESYELKEFLLDFVM